MGNRRFSPDLSWGSDQWGRRRSTCVRSSFDRRGYRLRGSVPRDAALLRRLLSENRGHRPRLHKLFLESFAVAAGQRRVVVFRGHSARNPFSYRSTFLPPFQNRSPKSLSSPPRLRAVYRCSGKALNGDFTNTAHQRSTRPTIAFAQSCGKLQWVLSPRPMRTETLL